MNTRAAVPLIAIIALAGCGGGSTSPPTPSAAAAKTVPAAGEKTGAALLTQAVRAALRANDRLSGYVLWANRVPAWATRSTRGPALAELRASAAARRRQGVRVRTLSHRLQIVSIALDASYLSATALVRERQRVLPYRAGRPDGTGTALDERARITLHRLAKSNRFIVWRLKGIR